MPEVNSNHIQLEIQRKIVDATKSAYFELEKKFQVQKASLDTALLELSAVKVENDVLKNRIQNISYGLLK
jgi:hypothetical protein